MFWFEEKVGRKRFLTERKLNHVHKLKLVGMVKLELGLEFVEWGVV